MLPISRLPVLVFAAHLATSVSAQMPHLPASDLRPLNVLAQKLAKVGRDNDTYKVLDTLRALGYPEDSYESLRSSCEKAMRKAKRKRLKADPLVKALDAGVASLLAACEIATGESQRVIAEQILVLDGEAERAHELLAHVQAHGRWIEPWMKPVLDREVAIERALADARVFKKRPHRVTISDVTFLERALGQKGVLAAGFGVTVHSSLSREATAAMLQQFARASAFAGYLLNGEIKPLRLRPSHYIFVHSREIYRKLLDAFQANGRMPAEEAERLKNSTFFWEPRNEFFVMFARTPAEMSSYLLSEALNNLSYRPQQHLRAALANYVCLAMLGRRMSNYVDSEVAVDANARSNGESLDAESSLIGLRGHVADRVGAGRAKEWRSLFERGEVGTIESDELTVGTSVMMMLCAERPMGNVLKACPMAEATTKEARIGQFEAAMGEAGAGDAGTVDAIDTRWRSWARSSRTSLGETLRSLANRRPDKTRATLLKRLDAIREKATESRGENELEQSKLGLHPLLSTRAAAHARYVAALGVPAAGKTWQELHVQDPTLPEFSIDGMRAGPNCLVTTAALDGPDVALDRWLASWDARLDLLHPGLSRIGYGGAAGGVLAVDCRTLRKSPDYGCFVKWPYDGMKNVPLSYAAGAPSPIAGSDGESGSHGYPVSVQVFDGVGEPSGALELTLFEGNPTKGNRLECFDVASDTAFGLIPKVPLTKRTPFTVVGTFANGERLIWKFKT